MHTPLRHLMRAVHTRMDCSRIQRISACEKQLPVAASLGLAVHCLRTRLAALEKVRGQGWARRAKARRRKLIELAKPCHLPRTFVSGCAPKRRSADRSSANGSPRHNAIAHATTFGLGRAFFASSSAAFICLTTSTASCFSAGVGRPPVAVPAKAAQRASQAPSASEVISDGRRARLVRRLALPASAMAQNWPRPR